MRWVQEHLGWTVDVVQKPRRWFQVPEGAPIPFVPAFTVQRRRWVVERTFAWLGRYRRLGRDYEFLAESEEGMIYLAMSRLMLTRICRPAKLP